MQNLLQPIKSHFINIPGWRTARKIVVFESDDWGSIRMPDKKTFLRALKKGLQVEKNPYCRYDTLANSDDLNALFDVLRFFKDKNGNHPVITANTVVANPDFNKIRESQYEEYQYEFFTDTLKHYYPNNNVFGLWQDGINEGLFLPQFHGREHVNVYHWLKALKDSHNNLKKAFDLGFWGVPKQLYCDKVSLNLQATYDAKNEFEVNFHKNSLKEGLIIFENLFGYKSHSFIPNNFIFDKHQLSDVLKGAGVSILQGMKYHKQPYFEKDKHPMQRRILGDQNGIVEMIRNATFEPSQTGRKSNDIAKCMNQIKAAFFWNKPAIITCHRLNFIGAIDEKNRADNLGYFKELLSQILKKWPNAEFKSSVELGNLITSSN